MPHIDLYRNVGRMFMSWPPESILLRMWLANILTKANYNLMGAVLLKISG